MSIFKLFVKDRDVQNAIEQIESLKKEKSVLKEELETLKLNKRLEAEEIKHMIKINEKRMEHELADKEIELKKEYADKISEFKETQTDKLIYIFKENHDKMETRFNTELGNLKEVYKALMERMPNVNLSLTKDLNGPRERLLDGPDS